MLSFLKSKYGSLILPSFFSVILSSCNNNPAESNETSGPDGKTLYESNCVICHGDDGRLGAAGASDLTVTLYSEEEQKQIIRNGKGGMTPFPKLSEEELNALVKYIATLKK